MRLSACKAQIVVGIVRRGGLDAGQCLDSGKETAASHIVIL
jgi:hypothetical protein